MSRVLREKVHVCFGSVPVSEFNEAYRANVFQTFLPLQEKRDDVEYDVMKLQRLALQRKQQRAVISYFLHGDMQDHEEIWFYTERWGLEAEHICALMDRYLVPVLVPRRPPVFSRSRWNGFEDALRWYGLIEACHGLLRPLLLDFLKASPTESNLPEGIANALRDQEELPANHNDDEDDAAAAAVRQEMDAVSGNIDWKALKLRMKQKVLVWLQQPVLPILIIMHIAVSALSHMFRRLLASGSQQWEEYQQTNVANGGDRSFPVLEAARGVDIKIYRRHMNESWHQPIRLMPRDQHLRHHQVLLFRMLSRNFCATEFHLGTSWASYPIRMFCSLDGVHNALKDPDCMLCPLSRLLVQEYPSEPHLDSEEAQKVLMSLANLFQLRIADVEARHASTRRITSIRGLQTAQPNLCLVSADWVCRNNVLQRSRHTKGPGRIQPEPDMSEQAPSNPQRKNPWNAFLSDRCKFSFRSGRDKDERVHALRDEYRALTSEEHKGYQEMADVAFCARQRGLPGFAPVQASSSSVVATSNSGEHRVVVQSPHALVCAEVEDTLALARKEHRKETNATREWVAEFKQSREEFQQDDETLRESLSCDPALLNNYVPALNGMLSADVHIPADEIAEASF